MNRQDTGKTDNEQTQIEDLPVNQDDAAAVKGGPTFVGGWGSSSYQYSY